MPFGGALTLGLSSLAGSGLGAATGKKASNSANKLAQQQFNLQSNIANQAQGNITPASNYFKALLSGDPTQIAAAVGPTSDILKGQGQAQATQIANTTPSGGEANMAQQQNQMNTYNQMARLYAGVQPAAAQALGGLGTGELGIAAPNVGSASKALQNQAAAANQKGGQLGSGAGSLLYQATRGSGKGSGGGKRPASPSSFPSTPTSMESLNA